MSTTISRKPNFNKSLAAAAVCIAAILICGARVANNQIAWRSSDRTTSVTFWGKNLLNTAYLTALDSQANGDFGQYGSPRTFGVTFKRTF
ncbi:MAG: hypothetical protein ACYDBZ_09600 [Steroidobacteraceae bacterium]